MRIIDMSYNPTVTVEEEKAESIRDGNAIVTGNANVVTLEIPKEEMTDFCAELHNMAVNSDVGDPKTFEQVLGTKRGRLWRFSMISEVNNFLYQNAWIPRNLERVRKKGRKPISVKWVFKTKLEPDGSERLVSRIVTKGYLQVPSVDITEKFSPVATDTSTRIIIRMTLYFRVIMIGHVKLLMWKQRFSSHIWTSKCLSNGRKELWNWVLLLKISVKIHVYNFRDQCMVT